MSWQLTEGALATLLTGGSVSCPVIQILGSKIITGSSPIVRYRLLVSDGCHLNSFVMPAAQLNDKLTSGELSDYCVVRVDRWLVSTVDSEKGERTVLIILALTILAKGQEVGRKIGNPVTFTMGESNPPACKKSFCQHTSENGNSLNWHLTEGAIATLLTGGSISCPVMQILGSKIITGSSPIERYRLLVSDGRHLNSFVMLATQLNDKLTSGELSDYCVVRVDRCIVSKVRMQEISKTVLIILDLTILAKGQEVGRKMGNPVAFPEGESNPPAVVQHVVAPVPAVVRPRVTLRNAAYAYAYLRRAMALPPEQLRGVVRQIGTWPSFPVHEIFQYAAEMPAVQMRAVVRSVMVTLSPARHLLARRRAAAA